MQSRRTALRCVSAGSRPLLKVFKRLGEAIHPFDDHCPWAREIQPHEPGPAGAKAWPVIADDLCIILEPGHDFLVGHADAAEVDPAEIGRIQFDRFDPWQIAGDTDEERYFQRSIANLYPRTPSSTPSFKI